MRDSIERPLITGFAVALVVLLAAALGCSGQALELISPDPSGTLQYRTDEFIVFFSPGIGEAGLEGLRLSITNTTGNTMSIDWRESYFILPSGERSDAVTDDIPASFQLGPAQIAIRQTVEIMAIPLCSVAHSEAGWSIGAIEIADSSEITLHLAVEYAGSETIEGYDFVFHATKPAEEPASQIVTQLPVWSALLALGVGFLLGLLLAAV
jgi:hypothetical protein